MKLYQEHLERTMKAVHMEKVDKVPFSFAGSAYIAKRQEVPISEAISDWPRIVTEAVKFCKDHPGIDNVHQPCMTPYTMPLLWLSEVKVPGVDLPDDEIWQVHEKEIMTFDDYQAIIDEGYFAWRDAYLKERLGDPVSKAGSYFAYSPTIVERMRDEAGIPVMAMAITGTPIENFCGARGLENFFIDMMEEPELVKQAVDVAFETMLEGYIDQLRSHPVAAWVGGWRAAPQLMSHDTWMEFVWPYIRKMVDVTIEMGVVPFLHFDSCWDSELETLRELPARTCVLMLDGDTDIRKAREVLDERMCLLGDVPASLLAFGTAEEVYDYATKLIDDVGPKTGLMLSSGCDCPPNAKHENVDAMIQATLDYQVR
ncbi:MAG: hypothetical protein IJI68_05485 [Eggerthellaceae bacterium]|nr:hypothetical protein [Eggerthellaceae bacterium]